MQAWADRSFTDKTFFFADYEGLRRIDGNPFVEISTVPTAFEQANPGNLTDIGGANIPAASIDPTSLAYFKLYPLPNRVGDALAGTDPVQQLHLCTSGITQLFARRHSH